MPVGILKIQKNPETYVNSFFISIHCDLVLKLSKKMLQQQFLLFVNLTIKW